MVTVYFKNGQKAEVREAVKVTQLPMGTGNSAYADRGQREAETKVALALFDKNDNDAGRFFLEEIVGYSFAW